MSVSALCLLSGQTNAHNGKVAAAVPIDGIVVDGLLDDWPSTAERYEIARAEFEEPHDGPADFTGTFRVALPNLVT